MGTSSETLVRDKFHLLANNTAQNKGLVDEQDKNEWLEGFSEVYGEICWFCLMGFASGACLTHGSTVQAANRWANTHCFIFHLPL